VQLTGQLCAGQRRTDLAELRLSGGVGSISQVVVVLDLWAGEENPRHDFNICVHLRYLRS